MIRDDDKKPPVKPDGNHADSRPSAPEARLAELRAKFGPPSRGRGGFRSRGQVARERDARLAAERNAGTTPEQLSPPESSKTHDDQEISTRSDEPQREGRGVSWWVVLLIVLAIASAVLGPIFDGPRCHPEDDDCLGEIGTP